VEPVGRLLLANWLTRLARVGSNETGGWPPPAPRARSLARGDPNGPLRSRGARQMARPAVMRTVATNTEFSVRAA